MTLGFEQDEVTGGEAYRQLRLNDGTIVLVSVSVRKFLKSPSKRYAYMQFKSSRKTVTKYVGAVTADSKLNSLVLGWRLLRQRKIAEANGWEWVKKTQKNT
jgi:hypothetical protein